MWALGLTFILTSSIVYYLFMAAWLNLTNLLNGITLLRTIIAFVALIGGTYNLYSYIKTRKETGCNVIDDKKEVKFLIKLKNLLLKKVLF